MKLYVIREGQVQGRYYAGRGSGVGVVIWHERQRGAHVFQRYADAAYEAHMADVAGTSRIVRLRPRAAKRPSDEAMRRAMMDLQCLAILQAADDSVRAGKIREVADWLRAIVEGR